jgi:hypothetical protein
MFTSYDMISLSLEVSGLIKPLLMKNAKTTRHGVKNTINHQIIFNIDRKAFLTGGYRKEMF